jgi:hypothetical protein
MLGGKVEGVPKQTTWEAPPYSLILDQGRNASTGLYHKDFYFPSKFCYCQWLFSGLDKHASLLGYTINYGRN